MIVRFQQLVPFPDADLHRWVHKSAAVSSATGGQLVDIEVDTKDEGVLNDLSLYMASRGFALVERDPKLSVEDYAIVAKLDLL